MTTTTTQDSLRESRAYLHPISDPSVPSASRSGSFTIRCLRPELGETAERMRCTKRNALGPLSYSLQQQGQQPSAVARRNARERRRVRLVNLGFATLRDHVPRGAKNKKLSKVETLRSAIEYIRQLQEVLGDRDHPFAASHELFDLQLSMDENYSPSSELVEEGSVASEGRSLLTVPNSASDTNLSTSPSPASSLGSDCSSSSPYRAHAPEEPLMDIGSWFS